MRTTAYRVLLACSGIAMAVMGIAFRAQASMLKSKDADLELACDKLAWYQSQPQEETAPMPQAPELEENTLPLQYAGTFLVVANCCEAGCSMCGGTGITASGAPQTPGVTAVADFDRLPAGTWIYIEGVGIRQVQDTGPACPTDHIDVAVASHAEALSWAGYGTHKVWILQEAQQP